MADRVVDGEHAAPAPRLAGLVGGYSGNRHQGFPPGHHLGLPSSHLELIISLGVPIRLAAMPDRAQPPESFRALAAGLQTGPAVIAHDGTTYALSLELTPAGARSLLGVPAGALAGAVVHLEDLLGRRAGELTERLAAAPDWDSRFTILDQMLVDRADHCEVEPVLAYVWRQIVDNGGSVRIGDLAAEVGVSRQHLTKRFRAEFGLSPKQMARVARFERSARLLRDAERLRRHRPELGRMALAEVAAWCGFFDQAHLAQEWNDLAGCPPSVWLSAEELPFVQAGTAEPLAASAP